MTIKVYKIGESWIYDYHQHSYELCCDIFLNALSELYNKTTFYVKIRVFYSASILKSFGFIGPLRNNKYIGTDNLDKFVYIFTHQFKTTGIIIPPSIMPPKSVFYTNIEILDIK